MDTRISALSASLALAFSSAQANDLIIAGIIDGPLSGGLPKAIELYVQNDINDLSVYGIGSANNGAGSDGIEFTLPSEPASAGSYIYVASEEEGFNAFFGFAPHFTTPAMAINGDDAIELYQDETVIDVYGDINVDGSDQNWEYTDGWAYRNNAQSANNGNFSAANWTFSGKDALDGSETNGTAPTPFPAGTHSGSNTDNPAQPDTTVAVSIGQCADDATLISHIQGMDDASAEIGNQHIIEAVVTAARADGFFVQEELDDQDTSQVTSEGVFVKANHVPVLGHLVRLSGTIAENFGMTTVELDDTVEPIDCGQAESLPNIPVTLPLTQNLESLEGMLVSISDATVTSTADLWRYGDLVVSNTIKRTPSDVAAPLTDDYINAVNAAESDLLVIEDNSTSRFPDTLSFYPQFSYADAIRIGDRVSAQGPLNFGFGRYRINPTTPISVVSTRGDVPELAEGNLTVATFNVLNYFNGQRDSEGNVAFDFDGNRGAESQAAFTLQQARIVEALTSMNADVVGLMEIENDGFDDDSAINALLNAVNSRQNSQNQYAFVSASGQDTIGSDAITVGLFYKPSVVTPTGDALIIPMPTQQVSEDRTQGMRPSLVQAFEHEATGQTFAVSVNHFKSKGSGCAEDNADNTSETDQIQGRCNALRVSAAVSLSEALANAALPERLIVLGDLNAYSAEDPIAVLTSYTPENRGYVIKTAINTNMNNGESVDVSRGFGLHNLADVYDQNGFSYWFSGSQQVGSLDHLLVSDALMAEAVDAAHWNINSVETYQLQYDQALQYYPDSDGYQFTDIGPFRSSDHDPLIVSFALSVANSAPAQDDTTSSPTPSTPTSPSSSAGGGSTGLLAGVLALVCVYRRLFKR